MQKKLPRRPIACIRKQTRRARWLTYFKLIVRSKRNAFAISGTNEVQFFKRDFLKKTELNGPCRNWQKLQLSQMANNKVHIWFDFLSIWDPSFSVTKMVARLTNHEVFTFFKSSCTILAWEQFSVSWHENNQTTETYKNLCGPIKIKKKTKAYRIPWSK